MARQVKQGSIAREALKHMRAEEYDDDPALPLAKLETDRIRGLDSIDTQEQRRLAKPLQKQAELERVLEETHRPAFAKRQEKYTTEMERLERWHKLGLGELIFKLPVGSFFRLLILIFLTFLDFFVFARAVAVAANVEASFGETEYWLGGLLGLGLSLAALLLGRSLKRASVPHAQTRLVQSLRSDGIDTSGLIRSASGFAPVLATGSVFAAMLAVAALLRFQSNADENIALVAFQLGLPVLIVLLEYLIDDPLELYRPRRSALHNRLERRKRRIDERINQSRLIYENLRRDLTSMFATERVILATLLQGRGLSIDEYVDARVQKLVHSFVADTGAGRPPDLDLRDRPAGQSNGQGGVDVADRSPIELEDVFSEEVGDERT
ncbi:MAG: hypothetical protein GY701_02695 [Sulfitobacter sp.]|nr:hypothetical protein [Sulfitobacter sp.]